MATMSRSETKKMYSWWWDSHISPKNSTWLKENLTDMDTKVRQMIKLIEVDEDSFARRAEMYYKKRPELMKLVEEFYRAYRALAERYDHATGILRQAQTTMAEAFPNQIPFSMADDAPAGSVLDSGPRTPEITLPARASFDPNELHGDAEGLSPSDFHPGKRNGAKQLNGLFLPREAPNKLAKGKVRKGLNFHEEEEKEQTAQNNSSEGQGKSETDIKALKEALAKLESEKLAGLLQYQKSLERLSNLELEVSRAQEDSKGYSERASKAEAEVLSLKEALEKLEAERELNLLQYQQCLDRISNLESDISCAQEDAGQLNERASKAEKEVESLREELAQLKDEKETGLAKYMEALEKIANLDNKLLMAEDSASQASERADKAEEEVEALRQAIARLTEQKEAAAFQYQKCLEKIAALERETALSQVEVERLKGEIDEGFAKLKGSEERCLMLERSNNSMQVILDSLTHQVGFQNEELAEKQKELGRLWACVQEERLRFAEAETTFQKLQNLHCQTQEELRSAAAELQKKVQHLKEMEIQNQHLQDEVEKFLDENKSLNDLYLSSTVSVKSMQDEIINLMEGKGKLEEELELRLDQRNALQQEIYCLKEELNDLSKKHQAVLEEVKSVGFDSECFGSSVIKLQNENSKLKESFQKSGADIAALVEKLAVMEKLVERNALLENLLSDLSSELERAREKMKALEESCQLLMGENSKIFAEKTTLISQLEMTTENLEKLSERNTFLENSLSDANTELEALRVKSKNLEDSCWFLSDEKSILVTERQTLASQLEATCQRMEELGKIHAELEQKYSILEEERKSTLVAVQELHSSLAVEKQEHANSAQLNQMQLADMKNQICLLQEVREHAREELEVELDKAVNAQLEIFILSKYVRDLKETNSSLLNKCEKLLEASVLSQRLISELEHENLEQQEEVILLSDQIKRLRMGMFQVLKALKIDAGLECEDIANEDKMVLHHILSKLDDTKSSLFKAWDENQKLFIEKSVLMTLIGQLKHEVADLKTLVNTLGRDFRIGNEQLSSLQQDTQKLLESNEELILRVREGNHREEVHAAEMKNLTAKLLDMQMACQNLEKENFRILSDERSLRKAVANLEEEKNKLEQDNSCLIAESVALGNISFFFKNFVLEKSADVEELSKNLSKLSSDNGVLEGLVTSLEGKVEKILMENMRLGVSLRAAENELREVRTEKDQLEGELAKAKNVMCQRDGELLEAEAIKADQGKQIHELSDKYSKQLDECQQLQQSIQSLGAEVRRMHKEHEEAEVRLESLLSELQKGKDEVELWETVAGTFFCELQSSSVREALFKEKLSELNKSYEDLEIESNLKDVEIVDLTERVEALAGENCQIKAQLAAYIPAISSLRDCVASLESHTALCTGFGQTDNEEKTEVESFQLSEEKVASELDMSVELMNAQIRIKAVEKAVVKMKRLAEEEYSNATSKLEAATRQIETLKSHSSSRRGSRSSRRFASQAEEELGNGHIDGWRPRKPASDAFEACGELLMKDIMLDQVSECSSYRKTRRDAADTDDQILELWETIDQAGSIDLTVGRSHRAAASPDNMHFHLEAVKEHKSGRPSSESLVEKELGISKQENSRRFAEPFPEENKNKILERIASDIQKLTNLQITVQDLKKKVEITNNSGKGKSVDYDNTKEQLEETEKAILKLLEVDGRLMKNIETSSYFDGLSSVVYSAEGGSSRRRKVLEQARRCSEKIGRLQMDVQKIQFHLLKLNGEKVAKGGTRIAERNTRVLLRDYLYGGARTPRRRRKSRFCACVQPPTKGD